MRPIIEFCTNNMHNGTDKVLRLLEANPAFDVLEYGCLGNCGQCYVEPYAMVDGDIVSADTPDELLEAIERHLAKLEEDPFADLEL